MRTLYFFVGLTFILLYSAFIVKSQDSLYMNLSQKILESNNAEQKFIWSEQLKEILLEQLKGSDDIFPFDSTGLLFELISKDDQFQLVTWAIEFNEKWEYFGLLKSYNMVKKHYQVYDLVPSDLLSSDKKSDIFDQDNWPAGVYTKLIENEYNKRKYYTFLGWLAPTEQTSHKFIEVMTLSKSGKPYFGKTNYFKTKKEYEKRLIFSYNRSSRFQLDYGEYQYTFRKWNRKKREYDIKEFSDELIVFDHLVSQYPQMPDLAELLIPVGNSIDAYKFENGKWIFIEDIDARNVKTKIIKKEPPKLDLFEQTNSDVSN